MQLYLDTDHLADPARAVPVLLPILNLADGKALLSNVVAGYSGYSAPLIDSCWRFLEQHKLLESAEIQSAIAEGGAWRRTFTGHWLAAHIYEAANRLEEALDALGQAEQTGCGPDHELHLVQARMLGRQGKPLEALAALRRAVKEQSDYGFLSKAARLLARLSRQTQWQGIRAARIAIVSSSTVDLVVPLLQLACFRDGIKAEIYTAPFGNVTQEIVNPESGLYRFEPDIVVIATHWRDAHLPEHVSDPEAAVSEIAGRTRALWSTLLSHRECKIIQYGFDLPATESYGHLSRSLTGGRGSVLRAVNSALARSAPPQVVMLDLDFVSGLYGKTPWEDPTYWYSAKQYPCPAALPLLVDSNLALIRAALGLSKKVLVLDLDNTLWGGVIGEDGLNGIKIGPPSSTGEAHLALQEYARALKTRGILLAVCSKNNEADARQPFEAHESMGLKLDDIVIFKANWEDKPSNLRAMATALNLGIDSFVMLDDNPVERALIRRELPEVTVPEIGSNPAEYVRRLDQLRLFEALVLLKEDLGRHESYRANIARDEAQATATSMEEFLANLGMEAFHGPVTEREIKRVTQLIGKTNQFNLTTRRYTEEQVRAMLSSPEYWTQWYGIKDRYGDYGIIGVIFARIDAEARVWNLELWLMSCRVIGRDVERFMLDMVADAATAAGAIEITGEYIPTAKNALVAELYPSLEFTLKAASGACSSYVLDLRQPRKRAEHITDATPQL